MRRATLIGETVSFTAAFALDAMVDPLTPFTWRQDRGLAGTGTIRSYLATATWHGIAERPIQLRIGLVITLACLRPARRT